MKRRRENAKVTEASKVGYQGKETGRENPRWTFNHVKYVLLDMNNLTSRGKKMHTPKTYKSRKHVMVCRWVVYIPHEL